uniref:Vav guanine nucleotide exchange factor 1 n=1 Tax=Sinocyclocheilus grahami TaxID=75366 RepID=A0A672KNS9_SINGR
VSQQWMLCSEWVCDLAHALRDGVLLCQLLNNLLPQSVNLRQINLRPQMSQFLCLKNIRTFLCACQEKFGMRKNELFEAFELFDVRDFAKQNVHSSFHYRPFPDEACEDDDLYDCVEEDENEGDDIYEDLMRTEEPETQQKVEVDKRRCFLMDDTDLCVCVCGRLLLYGRYCSQVEAATKHLDKITSTHEDVKMKLEECSMRANSGRFSLRDLLMVPMQRVLKYHLLLQELVKHTVDQQEKENLRTALDAMRDLAQCVNEVKRDNEIIRQITTFQLCIENMSLSLALYGRPKIDGEFKICSPEKKSKQDRYGFLFDKALLVCKKRSGESLELKELIELQHYQLRDEPSGEKDSKKWTHTFLLMDLYGQGGYDLYFKTRELKKKWLEQFEMALSNMCPENSTANGHDFQMHCFEDTTSCKACQMLLRGIFYQGYRCSRCRMAAHKECLGRVPACGRNSGEKTDKEPVRMYERYHGTAKVRYDFSARDRTELSLREGDTVKILSKKAHNGWWKGEVYGRVGLFPANYVEEEHSDYC